MKKLFVFVLVFFAFALRANTQNAFGSFQPLNPNTIPTFHKTYLTALMRLQKQDQSAKHELTIFDQVCGGYEHLLSRSEAQNRIAHSHLRSNTQSQENETSQAPAQHRPPQLKTPTTPASEIFQLALKSLYGQLSSIVSAIEHGSLQRLRDRMIGDNVFAGCLSKSTGCDYVILAASYFAKSWNQTTSEIRSSLASDTKSTLTNSAVVPFAIDPIRSHAISEDYLSYDLATRDRLQIQKKRLQNLSLDPTSEDLRILNIFHAASDPIKFDRSFGKIAIAIPAVSIASIETKSSGPSFFVRKLPIDYSLSTESPCNYDDEAIRPDFVVNESENLAQLKLFSNEFGNNVIPYVEFHASARNKLAFSWQPDAFSEVGTLQHGPGSSTRLSSLSEKSKIDFSKEVNRVMQFTAKFAIRKLRSGLNTSQHWLDQIETAMLDQTGDTKVAQTPNSNRTND